MASLAQINVLFRANQQQFSTELQNMKRMVEKAGKDFESYGKKMSLTLSAPLAALGAAAIKYGSDYEESLNKADVAFKGSSFEVRNFAKTTLESFGIAEGSALDMSAQFGDMGTSMGLTTSKASTMSRSLVGLAGDLSSFKNIGIEQATTALNGIFTGETESLKMLGIVMTEANLQQFAYSKGIKQKIKDMSQAEKVELRYAYVMAQTVNAQGDFARTGGGAANQMRIVKESLKQLASDFGQLILPVFTKIVVKINSIIKAFQGLDSGTKKVIIVVAGLAAAIGPLTMAYGYLLQSISKISQAFIYLKNSLVGVRIAKLALIVQTNALAVAQNLAMAATQLFAAAQMALTGNIAGATQAMNVFKASLAATPWGFVVAALSVAAVAYAAYSKEVKSMTFAQLQQAKMQKLESDLQSQATQIITTQKAALEGLLATAKNKYLSDKERQNAVKQINAMSKEYLGNITLEGIETEKTTQAVERYTAALLKGAMARAAQSKLDDLFKKRVENEYEAIKAGQELNKTEEAWKKNQTDNLQLSKLRQQIMKDDPLLAKIAQKSKEEGFDKEVAFLQKIIDENRKYLKLIEEVSSAQNAMAGPKKGTIEYYEALIKEQDKIQKTVAQSNSVFADAQTKIDAYQKAIDKISGKRKDLEAVNISGFENKDFAGSINDFQKQISKLEEQKNRFGATKAQIDMYAAQISSIQIKIDLLQTDPFDKTTKEMEKWVEDFMAKKEAVEKIAQDMREKAAMIAEAFSTAFEGLGGRISEALGLAATGMQGFLKVLLETTVKLISMMLAQSIATSVANATKSAAATGPAAVFTQPAFIATAVAGVLSAFAAIPKFETGGVVGGKSYYGDKILARLNSGELVLNKPQQKNLMDLIEPAGTNVSIVLDGAFKINGSDLELILDRVAKRNNRIK